MLFTEYAVGKLQTFKRKSMGQFSMTIDTGEGSVKDAAIELVLISSYGFWSEFRMTLYFLLGIKRYRILSDRLITKKTERYNDFLGVCAGLWNFYLLN